MVFAEQDNPFKLGSGLAFNDPARWQLISQRISTPLPIYNCPSRRAPRPLENTGWGSPFPYYETGTLVTRVMARGDYVACAGDQWTPEIDGGWPKGPDTDPYAYVDGRLPSTYRDFPSPHDRTDYTRADGRYGPSGVIYRRSETTMAEVAQKGTSNQYMIGEKFLRVDKYSPPACPSCSDGGDNENMFTGHNNDVERVTYYLPARDHRPPFKFPDANDVRGGRRVGNNETFRFGSAHPTGFNMMMADGSVHHIKYTINSDVFRQGGNRMSSAVGPFTN
jgi:prepilin-type processing-associated H-X9-DG protein